MEPGAAMEPGATVRPCPACGADVPGRHAICGACGVPVGDRAPADEVRRVVTVVQSDLKGSTALAERLDPETLREILGRYFDEMRAVFEGHGGTIEKIIGDAIVAVFGMPVAGEDDALRALEAAAESQRALAALNGALEATWGVRLTVRTGVATGEVVFGAVSSRAHVLTGEGIRLAAAMEVACPPFEVLVADPTRELVGEAARLERLEPVAMKGRSEPVGASRLVEVMPRALPWAGSGDARACSNCGEENPPEHRFCGICGLPLVFARARESRRTVTIVFADPRLVGLGATPPGHDAVRGAMTTAFEAMKTALERHGGTVEKFIGDAVVAIFGLPVRHEDDAVRAARAALELGTAIEAIGERLAREWGVRIEAHVGVNTGEVIAGDATLGQRLASGDAMNVAARLEQAAAPGETILGELTWRLARDFVEVEPIAPLALKGKAEPVPAFRLLAVRDAASERASSDAPFVGREGELTILASALDAALGSTGAAPQPGRRIVVGDAGVGKSRLVREFADRARSRARLLRGRCLSYGDGITFWPIGEVVREAAAIVPDDATEAAIARLTALAARLPLPPGDRAGIVARVAAAIGLVPTPFPVAELFWGIRRLLEALAAEEPLVLIVDDVHDAEPTLLELLDALAAPGGTAPLLLLCTARHELAERHAEWAEANAGELLVLTPLSDADAGRFVDALLGTAGLEPAVVARITAAAEGNPLFVEQLVAMLVDAGTLRREGERWVTDAAGTIAVPPSITALLAARLDALPPDERGAIEPASVIGLAFATAAVEALVPAGLQTAVAPALDAMTRKQLLRAGGPGDEQDRRFGHALVRDTAYESLLKRDRADLHVRFVDWAEAVNAARGRGQEFEEIHGYHLEQAYRYRVQLGVVDDSVRAIGGRASAKLASAGRRAMARGDTPAAASLLRRATRTRSEDDPERLALVPELGLALLEAGALDEAAVTLDETVPLAEAAGLASVRERARLVRCYVRLYAGDDEDWGLLTSLAVDEALPVFEAAGDEAGQTLAWRLRSGVAGVETRWEDMARAADQVIVHARRCGDVGAEIRASFTYANAALEGPTPVREALERCAALLVAVETDRVARAHIALFMAQLRAMAGDASGAAALADEARRALEEVRGMTAASTSPQTSRIARLAGDLEAAERLLRADSEALAALGDAYLRLTIDGLLAGVLVDRGAIEEAEAVACGVRDEAGEDDADAQALWRAALAGVRSRRGAHAEALELAEAAVEIRRAGQSPMDLADALERLGEVRARAGRREPAARAYREALRLATAKGDRVSAARIRSALPG